MKRDTLRQVEKRLKIRKSPTIDMLVKQVVLHTFSQMQIKANAERKCMRRAVGCSILEIDLFNELIEHYSATNGPSNGNTCGGKDRACRCSHAESRVVMKYLKRFRQHRKNIKAILVSTHLPCTHCANIIVDSELIDVVAYENIGSNISFVRRNGPLDTSLDVRLWSKELIENDLENNYIKSWLSKN